jgi:hypothetical protein
MKLTDLKINKLSSQLAENAYLNLKQNTMKNKSLKNTIVAGNSTLNLADITGQGVINTIWMAVCLSGSDLGGGWPAPDGQIRVYVDGESTPSITFDMNMLGAAWAGDTPTKKFHLSTEHVTITYAGTSQAFSFTFKYPIPYSSSIKIDWVNIRLSSAQVYYQVYYTPNLNLPYRLKSAMLSTASASLGVNAPSNSIVPIWNVMNQEGWLVYNCFSFVNAAAMSVLESKVLLKIDGETTPSIASSGIEDWFLSAWYFNQTNIEIPWAMVQVLNTTNYRTTAVLDILAAYNGIYFKNSLDISLDTTIAASSKVAYLFLYYVPK